MRAKFGSILGADVTDEICEYHSVRRVSSVREYRKSPTNHSYSQYQRSKRSFDLEAGAATTQSVPFFCGGRCVKDWGQAEVSVDEWRHEGCLRLRDAAL